MSFNLNGPSFRPMIQESQSMKNNGGGGNTGYFQRGKKKKEEKIDIFANDDERDTFTLDSAAPNVDEKNEKFLNKIIEQTKNVVKKAQTELQKKNNPFEPMSED